MTHAAPKLVPALLAAIALTAAACGGSARLVPKQSDVKDAVDVAGIDLRAAPEDAHGCVTMSPAATNAGALRTYGRFAFVIAQRDSCNSTQSAGSDGGNGIRWTHRGGTWTAAEALEDNLWLRMTVSSKALGDRQHALEKAAFHAFDAGN